MSGVLQVAIKFIERSEVSRHQKHVRREVVNHSSLLHPHVRACLPLLLTLLQPSAAAFPTSCYVA